MSSEKVPCGTSRQRPITSALMANRTDRDLLCMVLFILPPCQIFQYLADQFGQRDRFRAHEPSSTPLEDVDEFSLYRTIAREDPFPYSDSLHLDFLDCFGAEDVWALLQNLPPRYRAPLVLVHMDDLPTREVAALLDVPLGTLLARLHRGRKLFEKMLWEYAVRHDLLREPR